MVSRFRWILALALCLPAAAGAQRAFIPGISAGGFWGFGSAPDMIDRTATDAPLDYDAGRHLGIELVADFRGRVRVVLQSGFNDGTVRYRQTARESTPIGDSRLGHYDVSLEVPLPVSSEILGRRVRPFVHAGAGIADLRVVAGEILVAGAPAPRYYGDRSRTTAFSGGAGIETALSGGLDARLGFRAWTTELDWRNTSSLRLLGGRVTHTSVVLGGRARIF
jgi:opacity protein-like surface antigen